MTTSLRLFALCTVASFHRLSISPTNSSWAGQSSFTVRAHQSAFRLIRLLDLQGRVRTKTVKRASRAAIEYYYPRLTLDLCVEPLFRNAQEKLILLHTQPHQQKDLR